MENSSRLQEILMKKPPLYRVNMFIEIHNIAAPFENELRQH